MTPLRADRFAYAVSTAGVMLTTENRHLMCRCDVEAFRSACAHYDTIGAHMAWALLGVTPELMSEIATDNGGSWPIAAP